MKKIIAGAALALTALGLTACGSDADKVKMGPYEGETFAEAVRQENVYGVPEDYYGTICEYLSTPLNDKRLSENEFLDLAEQVGKDIGIDLYEFRDIDAEKIGAVIGLGVATGCTEYAPMIEETFSA